MIENQFSCSLLSCTSFDKMVDLFTSERYCKVLEEYRAIVERDPNYLTFHFMSTALKLQFHLKLNELPSLNIGGCMKEGFGRCCVVDALKEAIDRTSHPLTIVEKSRRWPG